MVPQNLSTGLTGRLEQQTALSLNQQRSLELLALPLPELDMTRMGAPDMRASQAAQV